VIQITLKDFTLTFPECLRLKDSSSEETLTLNSENKYVYTVPSETSFDLTKDIFSLDLDSVSFEGEDVGRLDITGGALTYQGEISLAGKITAVTLSEVVSGKIILTPIISIGDDSNGDGNGEVPIASVTGQLNPKIYITPTEVALEGLPDFLTDDEVVMDLADPKIYLNIHNPMDLPINIGITMQGRKEDENGNVLKETTEVKGSIPMPKKTTKKERVTLSKTEIPELSEAFILRDNIIDPKTGKAGGIPEEIKLDITAETDQTQRHTINLGETYPILMDYEIDMPLSFGERLVIIYEETIDGWNDQIKDLEMDNISLETTVKNTIPLELHIEGYAIDEGRNKIKEINVEAKKAIDAGKGETKDPVITKSLKINIKATNSKVMQQLDGVVLRFKANATKTVNNIPLNSSQYLIMDKISAKITGGMNIDLN
jgi:hypothetical protein